MIRKKIQAVKKAGGKRKADGESKPKTAAKKTKADAKPAAPSVLDEVSTYVPPFLASDPVNICFYIRGMHLVHCIISYFEVLVSCTGNKVEKRDYCRLSKSGTCV